MTTILAVRNSLMMFGDSLVNDGDSKRYISNKVQKITIPFSMESIIAEFKIPSEGMLALVGCAGESQSCAEFYWWCKQGLPISSRPRFNTECEINGLLLLQNQTLLRFDSECFPSEVQDNYYAVGMGRDFVIGALEALLDSAEYVTGSWSDEIESLCQQAMKIASKFSLYSSEPINMVSL